MKTELEKLANKKSVIVAANRSSALVIADSIRSHKGMHVEDGKIVTDTYIVTWINGNMISYASLLMMPQHRNDPLPIYIEPWPQMFISNGDNDVHLTKLQNILEEADEIILMGGLDDFTQYMFCSMLDYLNFPKDGQIVMRAVVKSYGANSIRVALERNNLEDNSKYDGYYNAGSAVFLADAIWGYNLSRYFSDKYHTRIVLGRTIIEMLSLLYNKQMEMEMSRFKGAKWYSVSELTARLVSGNKLLDRSESGVLATIKELEAMPIGLVKVSPHGNVLLTSKGKNVYESLPTAVKSVKLFYEQWPDIIDKIRSGKRKKDVLAKALRRMLIKIFDQDKNSGSPDIKWHKEVSQGRCPICGSKIIGTPNHWWCEFSFYRECYFHIRRIHPWFKDKGISKLPPIALHDFLKVGMTYLKNMKNPKTGERGAVVKIKLNDRTKRISFEIANMTFEEFKDARTKKGKGLK